MVNLKGINFDTDIDTQISDLKYLNSIDLIYDDRELELHNVYYNYEYDFAILITNTELRIDSNVISYDFVFSFDGCKLYKLTDTIFICTSPLCGRENDKNPIELFNKVKEHIN